MLVSSVFNSKILSLAGRYEGEKGLRRGSFDQLPITSAGKSFYTSSFMCALRGERPMGYHGWNACKHDILFKRIRNPKLFLEYPDEVYLALTPSARSLLQEIVRRGSIVRKRGVKKLGVSQTTLGIVIEVRRETVNRTLNQLETVGLVGVSYRNEERCLYELSPIFFSSRLYERFRHLFPTYWNCGDLELEEVSVTPIKEKLTDIKNSRVLYSACARARAVEPLDPGGGTMPVSDILQKVGQNEENRPQEPNQSANSAMENNAHKKQRCTGPTRYTSRSNPAPTRASPPKGYKSLTFAQYEERRNREWAARRELEDRTKKEVSSA